MSLNPQCAFDDNLAAASNDILQEVGADLLELLTDIQAMESQIPGIEAAIQESSQALDVLFKQGDPAYTTLRSGEDVTQQFGLEPGIPSRDEYEKYLSSIGIVMLGGVLHVNGEESESESDQTNISKLRRLYMGVGRDLSKTRAALNVSKPFSVRSQIIIDRLPPRESGPYTPDEIKRLLNIKYLPEEYYYVLPDHSALVYRTEVRDFDKPVAYTINKYNVPQVFLQDSIFHFGSIDTTIQGVNKWRAQGYTGGELSAILSGQDKVLTQTPILSNLEITRSLAASLVTELDKIIDGYRKYSANLKTAAQDRISTSLSGIENGVYKLIQESQFQVTVIDTTSTLVDLETQHSAAEIVRLLEDMNEVRGIKFSATDLELSALFTNATTVGTNLVSNIFLNRPVGILVDLRELLKMLALITESRTELGFGTIQGFRNIRDLMNRLIQIDPYLDPTLSRVANEANKFRKDPAPVIEGGGGATSVVSVGTIQNPVEIAASAELGVAPIQGQPNMSSQPETMLKYMDFDRSFKVELKLKELDRMTSSEELSKFYEEKVANALARVLREAIAIVNRIYAAIEELQNRARNKLLQAKQQLNAFVAKYLTAIGSGEFSSSILKCAVGFKIGLDTGLLDELLALVGALSEAALNLVSDMAAFVSKTLNRLLCKPVNLLNGIIGKVEQNLPSFCAIPRFRLGEELESALNDFAALARYRQSCWSGWNRDLVRFSAIINTLPNRLSSFTNDTVCNTPPVNNFLESALINVNQALPSPVSSVASRFLR